MLLVKALCFQFLSALARPALPVPEFTIDLDKDPEHRYDEVIAHFNSTVQKLVDIYAKPALLDVTAQFAEHRGEEDPELQGEINGIARNLGIPNHVIQTVAFLYEVSSLMVPLENITWPWAAAFSKELGATNLASAFGGFGCTGIIIKDEEGSVYHGRNLDFAFTKYFQNMTYLGTFTKGGKELFTIQTIAAYPMLLTGWRRGSNGYTIEINSRFLDHWGGNGQMLNNIFNSEHRPPSGWTKRKILETIDNYEDAVEAFSTRPYIATEYNIISGVRKGVILARNPDGNAYTIDLKDDDRYIIMTNFDYIWGDLKEHFDPTSVMGIGHSRRKGAMKLLDQTPTFTPESLMDLMFNKEVAAKDTLFQAVFNVEKDTLITRLPFCEACDGCVETNQCVSGKEFCCSMGSHYTLECAAHSATHSFRCGCLPDGACRLARPAHLINSSVGTEDCCSLEDHFSLECPGGRKCGRKNPSPTPAPTPTPTPTPEGPCKVESCSLDSHKAMKVLAVDTMDQCCDACRASAGCVGWIWKQKEGTNKYCHLKKEAAFIKTGCTQGDCTPCARMHSAMQVSV